jgi:nucleoside-diphosphate-sugar epimerase
VVHGPDLTESVEPKPFGTLGESKLLAEKYILSQYVVDKKVYVLRPSIIHGKGSIGNKNMKRMYEWITKGYPFPFGRFECSRSFTSMENLTYVLKRMLELDIPSGIYNVVDDGALSVVEVYEIMGTVLGKKTKVWRINKSIIRMYSKLGKRFNWYFNDYRYDKLTSNFGVSNEKIKQALGIEQMPVSAVEGLKKTVLEYKTN